MTKEELMSDKSSMSAAFYRIRTQGVFTQPTYENSVLCDFPPEEAPQTAQDRRTRHKVVKYRRRNAIRRDS